MVADPAPTGVTAVSGESAQQKITDKRPSFKCTNHGLLAPFFCGSFGCFGCFFGFMFFGGFCRFLFRNAGFAYQVINRQFLAAFHAENLTVHAFDALMLARHCFTPFLCIKKAACAACTALVVLLPVFEEIHPIRVFTVKYGLLFGCQFPGVIFKQIEDCLTVKGKLPDATDFRVIHPPNFVCFVFPVKVLTFRRRQCPSLLSLPLC
jgi:hypothetical protein